MTDAELTALRKTLASADSGCTGCVAKIVDRWNEVKPDAAPVLRMRADWREAWYSDEFWRERHWELIEVVT